jgi:hypothetical protein
MTAVELDQPGEYARRSQPSFLQHTRFALSAFE